ncbi:DNA mismatch repair protein MSH6 [Strigomonas culicis]|uniref:DNA mismatch repair protein MSH6 n=1 Tax=Strigomonas culicis TaxID=28005 RepID=S9TLK0_9TRYP|nr:DNA mismatch repair protein MSH6 [Strigomonas culicis]|eukprot:EPY19077.1 DNA mismatch repair protein MSH6 [Strigomonas culicis]
MPTCRRFPAPSRRRPRPPVRRCRRRRRCSRGSGATTWAWCSTPTRSATWRSWTNLQDGSEKHSLQLYLNHCATHSGRRLFRAWLLRPASTARVIEARQQCVQFLIDHHLSGALGSSSQGGESASPPTAGSQSATSVASTPSDSLKRRRSGGGADLDGGDVLGQFQSLAGIDFERYLSRLADMKADAAAGVAFVDPMVRYNKDLSIILAFIQAAVDMVEWASVLAARVGALPHAAPPLLLELLGHLTGARASLQAIIALFDREEAERTGLLVPARGTAPDYDAAVERLRDLEQQLHGARRKAQADLFRGAEVSFANVGKDLFLFEVAAADAPSVTPRGLVERTRTGKSVRYIDNALAALIEAHKAATATKSAALLAVLRQVAARICDHCPTLYEACSALSYLDCLMNLSRLAQRWERWGMPRLVAAGPEGAAAAVIRGRALVHPLLQTGRDRPAVPNSVQLDGATGRVLVLTGPNMAGKSTLMRTVAVNVLLAQLGGPVCGEGLALAPVDRIFTRIGARDASHKGHSTLYVELSETAELLTHATRRSLCLVDELGRGTSTHDGMAIAYATLQALQGMDGGVAPLTIFSTHYHSIALEQARRGGAVAAPSGGAPARVQLGYMDFALTADAHAAASEEATPTVTFLYQLVTGVCDRSYGVEVARMAGIPERLVREASGLSAQLAQQTALHEDLHAVSALLQS